MSDEFKLRVSIVEYIENLSQDDSCGLDNDSLEVALQCVAEALGIDMSSDAFDSNKLAPMTLLSVFSAGLTGGSADASTPVATSSAEVGSAEHWNKYVDAAASKGSFAGMAIGSSEYNIVLKTLAQEYKTKHSLAVSPLGADSISPADKAKADALKTQANACIGRNDYKNAIKKYSEAILYDPSNSILYANRSVAYYKTNKYQDALNDAKQSVAIDPNYTKGYFRIGQNLTALKNYTEAEEAFNKAHELAVAQNETAFKNDIQRELNSLKNKNKTQVKKGGKANNAAPGGFDLSSLMSNPAVQNMLSNPDLMKNLSGMLGGENGNFDMNALSGMLGGVMGDNAPDADNLSDMVNKVKDDPSVEALNDDPEMTRIMAEIEQNPAAAMQYLQNPEVMKKIQPLVQKFMSGMK